MNNKWDERYIRLARDIAQWSKDPSTKVGCIAVGEQGQVLAQGYNGFPRGIPDAGSDYLNRERKYSWIVHAELNVVYNASLTGVCLRGSTLYIWGLPPCNECTKGIIQCGIERVVYSHDSDEEKQNEKWRDSWRISQELFYRAEIPVEQLQLGESHARTSI